MGHTWRNVVVGTAAGVLVAAVVVPTVAGGNARPKPGAEVPLLARLTGAAEVPGPGDPDGTGSAAVTIDTATDEVCYDVNVAGIDRATLAHIHQGSPTVAGPIVVNFTAPADGSSSGCVVDPDADAIAADPGGYYVNVHNDAFPSGAIRGQLSTGPAPASTYSLTDPVRVYDSRTQPGAAKLAPGETRTISLTAGTGSGGPALAVPAGATAALVTLTITQTEGAGYLKLYSAALSGEPPTSNINWSQNDQNLAVATTVNVSPLGQVKITAGFGSTHVVVDVVGFLF